MENVEHNGPADFLNKLESLFANIETWVAAKGLHVLPSEMTLNEEAYGVYRVEKLAILTEDGKRVAEVLPVGASVIGAMGRVDLAGSVDREMLLFLDEGGASITTSTIVGNDKESHAGSLYRGVDEPGWYWIESRKISRARKLDMEVSLRWGTPSPLPHRRGRGQS